MKLKNILMGVIFSSLLISCTPKGDVNNDINKTNNSFPEYVTDLSGSINRIVNDGDKSKLDLELVGSTIGVTNRFQTFYVELDVDINDYPSLFDYPLNEYPRIASKIIAIKGRKNKDIIIPRYLRYSDRLMIDITGISPIVKYEDIDQIGDIYIPNTCKDIPNYTFDNIAGKNIYFEIDKINTILAHDMSKNTYHMNTKDIPNTQDGVFGAPRNFAINDTYVLGNDTNKSQIRYKFIGDNQWNYQDLNCDKYLLGKDGNDKYQETLIINSWKKFNYDYLEITNVFKQGDIKPLNIKLKVGEYYEYGGNNLASLEQFVEMQNGEINFKANYVGERLLVNPETGFAFEIDSVINKGYILNTYNVIQAVKKDGELISHIVIDHLEKIEGYNCREGDFNDALLMDDKHEVLKIKHVLYNGLETINDYFAGGFMDVDVPIYILDSGERVMLFNIAYSSSIFHDWDKGEYYDIVISSSYPIPTGYYRMYQFSVIFYEASK